MQLLLHGLQLSISPLHTNHPGYFKAYIFTGDACTVKVPIQPSVLIFNSFNCSEVALFNHLRSIDVAGTISALKDVPEDINMYYMENEDINQVVAIISKYRDMERYPVVAIAEPNHLWQLILIILLILLGISCILSGILHWYLYTPEEDPIRMLSEYQFNTFPSADKTTYAIDHDEQSCEENLCPICLDPLSIEIMTQLPCHHFYHKDCIKYWLTKKSSFCPVCKHDCLLDVTEDLSWFKKLWWKIRRPIEDQEHEPLLG